MRRADREVTDQNRIDEIIRRSTCCRLGLCDGDEAYIVPMSFGYKHTSEGRSFYFHSAKEGRKIALMQRKNSVSFELDTDYQLLPGTTACSWTANFACIMGRGRITFLEEEAAKQRGLEALMQQNAGNGEWTFTPKQLQAVCVFRLDVEEITCKIHG